MADNKQVSPEEAAKMLRERENANPQNFESVSKQNASDGAIISQADNASKDNVSKDNDILSQRVDRSGGGLGRLTGGQSEIHGANDSYYKNVPLQNLPTKGLFYPDGTEITIKAAEVGEIRHWSTIDENDFLDMDMKMNFIVEKCIRIKNMEQNVLMHWKDIKEIDRFYLIFLVHEFSFPDGENKLYINFGCNIQCKGDGTYREKVHLKSNMLNMFTVPEDLMQYYDPTEKCFVKNSQKLGEVLKFYMPTIGVSQYVKGLVRDARDKGSYIDPAFLKVAPYMIKDWRDLNDRYLESLRMDTFKWGKNKLLFIAGFSDALEKSVSLIVKKQCPRCDVELEAPLFFRGGFTIKSLFLVSGSIDDLV